MTVLAAAAALALAACGEASDQAEDRRPAARSGAATDDLPAALATNAKDADTLVGEGEGAFRARMRELRGHPVVVNQWASWCESCRVEFPFFRSMADKHRKTVAFLGLDSQDSEADAEAFMRELPVGFPSVFDPDASVARSLGGGTAWPTTFFFDSRGRQVHTKIGAYATAEQLDRDIERFADGG